MTTAITLGDEKTFICLDLSDILDKEFSLNIQMQRDGFNGSDGAWFYREDLQSFVDKLEAFNKALQGSVKLKDLSYGSEFDGFCLELFSLDRSGHVGIRANIRKPVYLGSSRILNALEASVCFEVEPSDLDRLIEFMKQLVRSEQEIG